MPYLHRYFCINKGCKNIIFDHADYIVKKGLVSYLEREYKGNQEKNIIVNVINDSCYVVDGNKHLVAILLGLSGKEDPTFGDLEKKCPGLLRIWFEGSENGNPPYDVYIPMTVNTDNIENVKVTVDCFKPDKPQTKVITGSVKFDDPAFPEEDRGRKLFETHRHLVTAYILRRVKRFLV